MLQQPKGDDFVIATGETHSIREFLEATFSLVGRDWKEFVVQDPRFMRPADVPHLEGDPRKAEKALGWKPKTSFRELVELMVVADLKAEGLDPDNHLVG